MARRREKKTYTYECTLTGKSFKTTRPAPNPEELISIQAYYELNPDKDDRPEKVKLQLAIEESE
ncbi:MAG: hypothetical protein DRQ88_10470 [Epsilonproteobacteria bacterium]|nr:MAG: hypothetical protein DRQ88_10470 [Campylobacterota bacterium]RLA65835.1 MAG: hypothetical protein DRQ89_00350 [Campylobacterota bacterium]